MFHLINEEKTMEENLTLEQQEILAELTPEEEARFKRLQQQASEKSPNEEVEVFGVAGASSDGKVETIPLPTQIIEGTRNPDTLTGGPGDDEIFGFDGNDKLFGKGGDDDIDGGNGNDSINGNTGDDLITGDVGFSEDPNLSGMGNDTLKGGKGNDILVGYNGLDKIWGGFDNDRIFGGNDNDILGGGKGNDKVEGGNNDDIIYGGPGEDRLRGDSSGTVQPIANAKGNDTIFGGDGKDLLEGGKGNDTLKGGNGNDTLVGGQGNDKLKGGKGEDRLIGTDTDFFGPPKLGFGVGEIDTLTGGQDNDKFVLGLAEAGTRTKDGNDGKVTDVVLYNNGNDNNGAQDYALITDFVSGTDKIELAGSQSMYSLGSSPIDGTSGTGIFLEEGQNPAELIGLVKGISQDNLNLTNKSQFIYV